MRQSPLPRFFSQAILCSAILLQITLQRPTAARAEIATHCYSASPTTALTVQGSVDETTSTIDPASIPSVSFAGTTSSTTTFNDLEAVAAHHTTGIGVTDSLGASHDVRVFFFHTDTRTFLVRTYVRSESVDPSGAATGIPRQVGTTATMTFNVDGTRNNTPAGPDMTLSNIPWNNGSQPTQDIDLTLSNFSLVVGAPSFSSSHDGQTSVVFEEIAPAFTPSSAAPLVMTSAQLDARAAAIDIADVNALTISQAGVSTSTGSFDQLLSLAGFSQVVSILDSNETPQRLHLLYFKTAQNSWNIRAYVDSKEVDPTGTAEGLPRQVGPAAGFSITFNANGTRLTALSSFDLLAQIPWNNGRTASTFHVLFPSPSQFAWNSKDCLTLVDYCPADTGKAFPGICGCGESDQDSDADGVADCNDACPSDTAKLTPGACGCGTSDEDSDDDGTSDCLDACPADATKIAAGDCGCGVSELDANRNGAPDCIDPTTATVPEAPEVTITGRTARVAMQDFSGRVRYRLVLKSSRGTRTVLSDTAQTNVRRLRPGRWELSYFVGVLEENGYHETERSPRVRFRIE